MRRAPLIPTLLAGLLAAAAPATAQDAGGEAPSPEKCRADPQPPDGPSSGAQSGEARPDEPADAPDTLTGTLAPCDGVLAPPRVGDEIAEPPPSEGRTPVIRPGEIPDQPDAAQQ